MRDWIKIRISLMLFLSFAFVWFPTSARSQFVPPEQFLINVPGAFAGFCPFSHVPPIQVEIGQEFTFICFH